MLHGLDRGHYGSCEQRDKLQSLLQHPTTRRAWNVVATAKSATHDGKLPSLPDVPTTTQASTAAGESDSVATAEPAVVGVAGGTSRDQASRKDRGYDLASRELIVALSDQLARSVRSDAGSAHSREASAGAGSMPGPSSRHSQGAAPAHALAPSPTGPSPLIATPRRRSSVRFLVPYQHHRTGQTLADSETSSSGSARQLPAEPRARQAHAMSASQRAAGMGADRPASPEPLPLVHSSTESPGAPHGQKGAAQERSSWSGSASGSTSGSGHRGPVGFVKASIPTRVHIDFQG